MSNTAETKRFEVKGDLSDHFYELGNKLEFLRGAFTAMGSCDEGCFDPRYVARGATLIVEDLIAMVHDMEKIYFGS